MGRRKTAAKRHLLKASEKPRKFPLVGLCVSGVWRIVNDHTGETLRDGLDMKRVCSIVHAQHI